MQRSIRVWAPAKVNLVLSVGARRADGYHEVRTVLQAISLWDSLVLTPQAELAVVCEAPGVEDGPFNLAWRAAEALRRAAGITLGARIVLMKAIPVRAGLGGGSADAAAALVGCNRLWGLDWPMVRLAEVASMLGADVPFFLSGGTALGEGRGDVLTPLPPLPSWPVVVACPEQGSATAAAYDTLDALGQWHRPAVDEVVARCRAGAAGGPEQLAAALANSFEDTLAARPDILTLKRALEAEGALRPLLCGSGAAVWGLVASARRAEDIAARLRALGFWAQPARFLGGGVRLTSRA